MSSNCCVSDPFLFPLASSDTETGAEGKIELGEADLGAPAHH